MYRDQPIINADGTYTILIRNEANEIIGSIVGDASDLDDGARA